MKLKLKLLTLGVFLVALAMSPTPALAACQYTEYANVMSEGACIGLCRYYGCSNYEYLDMFEICYCEVPSWIGTGTPITGTPH